MGTTNAALSDFNAKVIQSSPNKEFNEFYFGLATVRSDIGPRHIQDIEPQSAPASLMVVRNFPPTALAQVKSIIKARKHRSQYFSVDLFSDPAWDILLDLTRGELECQRISISSLCIAAQVPATTALSYIKTLTAKGLLLRRPDNFDRRRVFIELSPPALDSMLRYLDSSAAQVEQNLN